MRLLGLCGSLRKSSVNHAALAALVRLAADGEGAIYDGLALLPPFDPDLDDGTSPLPEAASQLRAQVARADGLAIAAPEYAHGPPGAFKNALDWLVGDVSFAGKPVMLINTAPRAFHAQAQLREILATMAARVIGEACVTFSAPAGASADSLLADPETRAALDLSLRNFRAALPR